MARPFGWLATLMRACTLTLACAAGMAAAAATPEPIDDFTKLPAIGKVSVSPSGKRLAMLMFGSEGQRQLGVMDLDPIGKLRAVAAFSDADITSAYWVSDDRLVYEASVRNAEIYDGEAGIFAINHDGSAERQLVAWRNGAAFSTGTMIAPRVLPYGWFLYSTIDDGGDDVFIYKVVRDSVGDLREIQLARLNTNNGATQSLSYGMPAGTRHWLLDAKREPRMLTAERNGRTQIYWRSAASEPWSEVANFDSLKDFGFDPWFIDADGKILVVARAQGDTSALFKFDPITKRVEPEPLVSVPGFDLNPSAEVDSRSRQLLGLHFTADRPASYWFDASLQRIQNGLDAALPGRNNRLVCGRCETTRFFVVASSSDRQPVEYFLFDRSKSSLAFLGASRPWIDEKTQGRRSLNVIAARDGLRLPVYVTHPAGAAANAELPAVVLVHGGPYLRGSDLSWHAKAQFLASRGYRVLEPEFRGTEGYGHKLFRAGWQEWGRAMQDDLVDTVQWAAKQHLIDPARVCIVGSSYGGYAALMAPIATPGVFKCAASFAGVTDIDLMYSVNWSDTSEAARRYSMPTLIGDPAKDADRLAAASPLKRVAEIKIPLLVAHGRLDQRVPIVHEEKFISAARKAGVQIDAHEYPDEGHGFVHPANEADYFGRLERFLEKSLAGAH